MAQDSSTWLSFACRLSGRRWNRSTSPVGRPATGAGSTSPSSPRQQRRNARPAGHPPAAGGTTAPTQSRRSRADAD